MRMQPINMIALLHLFLLVSGCTSISRTQPVRQDARANITCCEALIKYNVKTGPQYQPSELTFVKQAYKSNNEFKEFQHRVDIALGQYFLWSGTIIPYSMPGQTTGDIIGKPMLYICDHSAFAFRKVKNSKGSTGERVAVLGRYVGSSLEMSSGSYRMIIPLLEDCYVFNVEECNCK